MLTTLEVNYKVKYMLMGFTYGWTTVKYHKISLLKCTRQFCDLNSV